jgi:hypothetical protein
LDFPKVEKKDQNWVPKREFDLVVPREWLLADYWVHQSDRCLVGL